MSEQSTRQKLADLSPKQLGEILSQGIVAKVHDTITIRTDTSDLNKSFACRKLGNLASDLMFISHPMDGSHLVHLKAGQVIEIRQFDGMDYFLNEAEVERVIFTPEPFVIIRQREIPETQIKKIRQTKRIPVSVPCEIKIGEKHLQRAVMTDMSDKGAMLLLEKELPANFGKFDLHTEFVHNGHTFPVKIECDCRRYREEQFEEGAIYTLGVHFGHMDPLASLCLSNFIRGELLDLAN